MIGLSFEYSIKQNTKIDYMRIILTNRVREKNFFNVSWLYLSTSFCCVFRLFGRWCR